MQLKKHFCAYKALALILCISIFSSVFTSCTNKEEIPELLDPVSATNEFTFVKKGTLSEKKFFESFVNPEILYASFQCNGTIKTINKRIGDTVSKGEILCSYDLDETDEKIKFYQNKINQLYQMNEIDQKLDKLEIDIKAKEIATKVYEREQIKSSIEKAKYDLKQLEGNENSFANQIDECKKLIKNLQNQDKDLEKSILEIDNDIKTLQENEKTNTGILNVDIKECQNIIAQLKEKKNLSNLYSPCNGVVLANMHDDWNVLYVNDYIEANIPIYFIANTDKKYLVSTSVSDKILTNQSKFYAIIKGEKIPLKKVDYSSEYLKNHKNNCEKYGYQDQTLPCRFTFENESLMDQYEFGENVTIMITENETLDTLYISKDALYRSGNETYVIRINNDNTQEKINVKTGISTDYYVEILEGVEENDLLLTSNTYFATTDEKQSDIAKDNYVITEINSNGLFAWFVNYQRIYVPYESAYAEKVYVNTYDYVETGDKIVDFRVMDDNATLSQMQLNLENIDQNLTDTLEALEKEKTNLYHLYNQLGASNANVNQLDAILLQMEYMDVSMERAKIQNQYDRQTILSEIQQFEKNHDYSIYSNIDGSVDVLSVEEGQSYCKGNIVAIVSDLRSYMVNTGVSENFHFGDRVKVTFFDNSTQEEIVLDGTVVITSDCIPGYYYRNYFMSNNYIKLDHPEELFESNRFYMIRKVEGVVKTYENSLRVSKDMVYEDEFGTYLYISNDGIREKTYVTLSPFIQNYAYVLDGIDENCTVITH